MIRTKKLLCLLLRPAVAAFVFLAATLTLSSGCDPKPSLRTTLVEGPAALPCVANAPETACQAVTSAPLPVLGQLSVRSAKPGSSVLITGENFYDGMILTIDGLRIRPEVLDSQHARFTMPGNFGSKQVKIMVEGGGGGVGELTLLSDAGVEGVPIFTGSAGDLCSDQKYRDASGSLHSGTRDCQASEIASCVEDGEIGCLTSDAYVATATKGLSGIVLAGQSVAGVAGAVTLPGAGKVLSGVRYGIQGTSLEGSLTLPPANRVAAGTSPYGSPGAMLSPAFSTVFPGAFVRPEAPVVTGAAVELSPTRVILTWQPVRNATGYLVVAHTGEPVAWVPTDGREYSPGSQGEDHIIYRGSGTSFAYRPELTPGVPHHFAIYAYGADLSYSSTAAIAQAGANLQSCAAILQSGQSSGSGSYYIDPEGLTGTLRGMPVYCDMTGDGGGWMLVAASDPKSGATPVISSLPTTTSYGILEESLMRLVTSAATEVRLQAPSFSVSVVSADSYPIGRLQAYLTLNDDANKGNPALHWNAPPVNFAHTSNAGVSPLSEKIFHGAGNAATGLHWLPSQSISSYSWALPTTGLTLWIR